jgi:L-Lysine epsilon oxidase N-terminal/L-lysine epsilon oxidase C-terminal domain/von Willebrand factor type A domain
MAIVSVKIHPAIGIARLGNSPDDWFLGPERPGHRPAPPGGYKDASCRVKRQGARFRIFGYDAGGNVEQEVTAADATIEWHVHLVNRKAAADKYGDSGQRNAAVTGADRDGLVIDSGNRTLNGPDQQELCDGGVFKLPGYPPKPVTLGEVRTDDDGRLVVLGGFGVSGSPSGVALGSTFNSDSWHDDVSDGPVTATVTIGGNTLQAESAWVIVGPPKFAPPLESIITLYDRLAHIFVTQGWLTAPATPSYTSDIYPILDRAHRIPAVRSSAQGHHAWVHPVIATTDRQTVFGRLTSPTGPADMPDINQGPLNDGRLTPTQYGVMEKWKDGTFTNDWVGPPAPPANVTPDGMDRAALDDCVGGAFFPGIEAGAFLLDASLYTGSFRLDHSKVAPGDVTARMALPWQSDFNACGTDWWPVPRPNEVIPEGTTTYQAWSRGVGSGADMVTKWHTLGFVVDQPGGLVEADRCDTATITLLTPNLAFVDVPQGYGGAPRRQSLAVVFEVIAPSAAVTLDYLSGPTHPRVQRLTAGPVTVGPTGGASVAVVRFFIAYQTGSVGELVTDAVTIHEPVSGQQWTIDITANTVARKKAAAALVLDRSGSMSEDRGDGVSKYQSLQQAAELFVDVMQQEDAASLTAYNQNATVVSGLVAVGPQDPLDPPRNALKGLITGGAFAPAGSTSIGNGIEAGRGTISGAAGYDVKALLVLTDGKENRPKWIADVTSSIDEQTFAIGIGTPQNTSIGALQTLAGNHGGYGLVTGSIGGDNLFRLQKFFLQILAGVTNADIVLDPQGELRPGSVHRIPFLVTEADYGLDVIALSPLPKYLQVSVESPNGLVIDRASASGRPDAVFSEGRGHSMYRLQVPMEFMPGRFDQQGTWTVTLGIGRADQGVTSLARAMLTDTSMRRRRELAAAEGVGEEGVPESVRERRALPYNVVVHSYSDVSMRAALRQPSFEPGTVATVEATLTQFSAPLDVPAAVRMTATAPDGTAQDVILNDLGGGRYAADYMLGQSGAHQLLVRAVGTSLQGWPFTREQALSASVWQGGDREGGDPGLRGLVGWLEERDEALCELLLCLLKSGLSSPELERLASERGIDAERLLECVRRYCARRTQRGDDEG